LNVITNSEIVLNACLARKASSKPLHFRRSDFPETDPPEWNKLVTVKCEKDTVAISEKPLDYYGSLKRNYESHNFSYLEERKL
jgi:succinate dehydrogenase/fumarate reductase flavoprotein subunit